MSSIHFVHGQKLYSLKLDAVMHVTGIELAKQGANEHYKWRKSL